MCHTAIPAYVTLHGTMAEATVHFGNSKSMIRRHYLNLMSREIGQSPGLSLNCRRSSSSSSLQSVPDVAAEGTPSAKSSARVTTSPPG